VDKRVRRLRIELLVVDTGVRRSRIEILGCGYKS
jgi:hypothetical protein